ncbi:MAG TPA: hypothetical protein VGX48_22670 [Pyrinomonadaceae bacterium]|nr:hypothetical protein [Pyrinomonadaceae bacterium]
MNNVMLKRLALAGFVLAASSMVMAPSCEPRPRSGRVLDEARAAGRAPESFPAADEDYFRDMDGGLPLTKEEVKGRNMWNVWTGGNDRFWDTITVNSFGSVDLLKTLSSHPSLKFSRSNRWVYLGLVNEPCFEKATGPDPARHNLWLDKRINSPGCAPDPFENEAKYPGVKTGARGRNMPVGSFYGWASGIVGLRLFPNPAFDEKAARKWDAKRFYEDPTYYNDRKLVRPYRVGMSCGFCHVGPDPLKPPADPENPKWENLSSSVGGQYVWIDRILDWKADPTSYVFQMFRTSRPGTVDTSLISTDNINNPRTMNAIYLLGPRLEQAMRLGRETMSGGALNNKQLNDYLPPGDPLNKLFVPPATVYSPRVLKDGADSVGALGALNRVYINIGLFSEEWLLHFNALVGGVPTTAIEISVARKNSAYWGATEMQSPYMASFFLKVGRPHKLRDAPGGGAYLTKDQSQLDRGRVVFAENCARCHSSKLPSPDRPLKMFETGGCSGPDYMKCWDEYWAWTKTDEFKSKMRAIVARPDFLDDNFLSAEHRVPVTLLQTNACSPLATNGIRGNIWDNFTSETYKQLPPVGDITVYNPETGEPFKFKAPGGGRGYTRPPSLVSLWSTAPFLLNNALGRFYEMPTVEDRMKSFDNSVEQLLWPEKRRKDPVLEKAFAERGIKDFPGHIDRTTQRSYIRIAPGYVPDELRPLVGIGRRLAPNVFRGDGVEVGPIPPGFPIGLLSNLSILPEEMEKDPAERLKYKTKVLDFILRFKKALKELGPDPTDEQARQVFAGLVGPMLELSKCPDYIVNRGHYFGTGYDGEPALSDEDKRALIEYLKTF